MLLGVVLGKPTPSFLLTELLTVLSAISLTRHPHNVTTPSELLALQFRRDPARPLLTFYDDATGERVELSVATTANWVAKTANFLIDEHGVDPGDLIGVTLPLHWQTAVVLLAAWEVGASIGFAESGVVTFVGPGTKSADSGEVIELSLAPMGVDFSRLVAAQPDQFVASDATGDDVVEAAPIDLPSGARVLSVVGLADPNGLGYGLIGPLTVDGSAVYVVNPNPAVIADRAAAEQVTHTVGIDVPGLPRL